MPDITREEFLRGLRLSHDAEGTVSLYGPDGDHVVTVQGNLGLDLSAEQVASWLVTACHEYAARRNPNMKGMTHWQDCWRAHPECAQRLLERWWPVIEAARALSPAEWERLTYALDDVWWGTDAVDTCHAIAAALKEGSADACRND